MRHKQNMTVNIYINKMCRNAYLPLCDPFLNQSRQISTVENKIKEFKVEIGYIKLAVIGSLRKHFTQQ